MPKFATIVTRPRCRKLTCTSANSHHCHTTCLATFGWIFGKQEVGWRHASRRPYLRFRNAKICRSLTLSPRLAWLACAAERQTDRLLVAPGRVFSLEASFGQNSQTMLPVTDACLRNESGSPKPSPRPDENFPLNASSPIISSTASSGDMIPTSRRTHPEPAPGTNSLCKG